MKTILAVCLCFFSSILNICFGQQPKLMLPVGHTEYVMDVVASPDGNLLLSTGADKNIFIWDKKSGRPLEQITCITMPSSVQFLNNHEILVLYINGLLQKINLNNKKNIYEIQTDKISSDIEIITGQILCFSKKPGPLSGLIASGTRRDSIEIRTVSNGILVKKIEGNYIRALNHDQTKLATVNIYGQIMEYALPGFVLINTSAPITGTVKQISYSGLSDDLFVASDSFQVDKDYVSVLRSNTVILEKTLLNKNHREWKNFRTTGSDSTIAFVRHNQLIYQNLYDTAKNHIYEFKSALEDIQYTKQNKHILYYMLENGVVGALDESTLETVQFTAHESWSGKLIFISENEFISKADDKYFSIWKTGPLRHLSSFTGYLQPASFAVGLSDGRVISQNAGAAMRISNEFLEKQKEFRFSKGAPVYISAVQGDSVCILLNAKNEMFLYNIKKNEVQDSFIYPADSIPQNFLFQGAVPNTPLFFDDHTIIQNINENSLLLIWDTDEKQVVSKLHPVIGLKGIVADRSGRYLLVMANTGLFFEKTVKGDDDQIEIVSEIPASIVLAQFSYDSKSIVFQTDQSLDMFVFDIKKKEIVRNIPNNHIINCISTANNLNLIAVCSEDSIFILNLTMPGPLISLGNNFGIINSVSWLNDHVLILAGLNGVFTYYNISKKEPFLYQVIFPDLEQVLVTGDKYYSGPAHLVKKLSYVLNLKSFGFQQLDVKYNRPDKVMEALGNKDTALIKSYRKAYYKRIKKLGIDTLAFRAGYSVPEADVVNRSSIEYEQSNPQLILHIKGSDSIYKPDHFNIWVNEVPFFGLKGKAIHGRNSNSFDTTVVIILSQGENRIETSITNVNGTESYRMPLQVNYTPANKQAEKIYFIGIGIDQFKDSKYNLKYSTKDIRDLSKKLKEKYKDIIIDTLFNENVTINNVKALKQKLQQTSVNDKVIISYSGHGMLSKDFDYYLSTYSVNFDKPEENGLPYDELESLLDSIPARKKLLLIDACHSGEVDKEDLVALNATDEKLIKGLKPVAYKNEGHLGLKNSFELMQSLFVNVGKSTGATIISAAAGTQFALEGIDNLPNGVFTYCILEAMNKYPTMKISELKKIVGDRVVEITKGLQKPTGRNETIAVDWEIW